MFLISVATEKFIGRLAQAGQRIAERQSRVNIQERDICERSIAFPTIYFQHPVQVRLCGALKSSHSFGVSPHLPPSTRLTIATSDVLSEPDDSYPIHEPKAARKPKIPGTPSGSLGKFFSKPSVSAADLEDIAMNEGETAAAGEELSA